jgi:small subunit ribosomal protein S15
MPLTVTEKAGLIEQFGESANNTGSTEVQIAIFHNRIAQLQEHLKMHKHDHASRRGLLRLVGKRRRMLAYLRKTNPQSYQHMLASLGLRR